MNETRNTMRAGNERPVTRQLHPRVYALIGSLSLWFVLSVWLFSGPGVTDYLLFIVSGFIFIAATLPFILSRVGRGDRAVRGGDTSPTFRDWRAWDFDTWQSRLTGRQAAAQILLPLAAVAFGMTIFGIALHVVERSIA